MNEIINMIGGAERGGLLDLGKALRNLLLSGGSGGGGGGVPASAADFRAGTSETSFISPAVFFAAHESVTLIETNPVAVNMGVGINFLLTLSDDRTISNPTSYKLGQSGVIVVQQDGTGGHELSWGSDWKFKNNTPPVLETSANAWTLLRYYVQALNVIRVTTEATGSTALNAATVEEIRLGLEGLKFVSPAGLVEAAEAVVLFDEPLILIDLGDGQNFSVTLAGNRTMDNPLDQKPGRSGTITVKQDDTGGRTLAWSANWKSLVGTPSIPSGANEVIVFRYFVESVGTVRLIPQTIAASTADVWTGTVTDKYIAPVTTYSALSPVALAGGTVVTPNFSLGLNFTLTLDGNWQVNNPLNQKTGQTGIFLIVQGASGNNTLTWSSDFKFMGGVTPVIPINPGDWTIVPYYVFAPGSIRCSAIESTSTGGGGTTIPPASITEIRQGLTEAKYVSPLNLSGSYVPHTLTDGATIVPDMNLSSNFIVTLGGNRTMSNMLNQKPGFMGFFIIVQDGTGSRTLAWGSNYSFIGGTPILPTAPASWFIIPYYVQASGNVRCITTQTSVIPTAASTAEYQAGTLTTKYISPFAALSGCAPVPLTDGATINVNFAAGINFKVIIAGDRSMANPTGQVAGQEGKFIIYQDAAGGRSLTWGSHYKFETGVAPTLNAAVNAFTTVAYYVEEPNIILMGA